MIKKFFGFFFDKSLLIFLIVGGLNTIVSTLGSQLLYPYCGYWASTAIMFTVCSVFSFIFNRKYSFQSKAPLLQSIIRFSVVIAVCYLFAFSVAKPITNWGCGLLLPNLTLEWIDRIAMLVAQVFFTGFNYIGQRLWAFKD